VFFAALAVVWTWPLARHLSDSIPGNPGDNFSFLWNLWWMRHVRATPGLQFFRTTFLFHPFGTTIVDHPHTALPAFIAATAFKRLSLPAAQNVILLAYVFANMAAAYCLAWSLTRHRRGAILAGVAFGLSPYFSAHLLGHFDLMAGWVLPVFALLFHRAIERRSTGAAAGAGLIGAVAAYTAYYYVVYLALFAVAYALAVSRWIVIRWEPRQNHARALQRTLIVVALLGAALALWIAVTGGATWQLGRTAISVRQPQNPLSLMWLALIGAALCGWRPRVVVNAAARLTGSIPAAALIVSVFVAACAPIIVETARVVWRGEYVSQVYFWRSAPRGIDLIAPLLGHPRHPFTRTITGRAYSAVTVDYIETVAWMGIVPMLLLFWRRRSAALPPDERVWWVVAAVFGVWAAGPFLTVGGFDSGLWLPESLARYVPFVANARMPGRAMVGVYLAGAVLLAFRFSRSGGRLGSASRQWLIIAAVLAEFCDVPVPLTALDDPAPYRALAAAPPGAVCEVPFGIGDGLGGAGSQDRRVLFSATIHQHPLVGGYIGRMPPGAERRYESMPVVGTLLRLSRRPGELTNDGASSGAPDTHELAAGPCRYLVVNRGAASDQLQRFVRSLPVQLMATDASRDVYRLQR